MTKLSHSFDNSIIRSYDIRGIFNKTLFEKDARAIGQLFGIRVGKGETINVGYDGRKSSKPLKEALIKGILESGTNVCEIGLVPTPLLYFSSVLINSKGGIMVTGSHNPKDYNGFKFVLDNLPFYGKDLKSLEKKAQDFYIDGFSGKREKNDFKSEYLMAILRNFSQSKNINIVWDSGNGAAGRVMEEVSKKIVGQHKLLFKDIDGNFPNHHPDPSDPKNLVFCKEEIIKNGFDLGIAFDGDGDRIGVVDDKGRIVPGDVLLLVLSKNLSKKDSVVIGDVKCSQVLFDEIKKAGGTPVISQTGHSHVKMNMKKYNADIAGEMSGHIFFKSNYGFDDALYAAIQLIKILSNTNKKLSEIIDEIPKVYNTPEIRIECEDDKKFTLIDNVSKSQKKLKKEIIDIDGLRVKSKDGWWLLRASNTQPSIVLRCESTSLEGLNHQLELVRSAVKEFDFNIAEKILVEN